MTIALKLSDGTKFKDKEVLEYLSRLAADAFGFSALSTVCSSLEAHEEIATEIL